MIVPTLWRDPHAVSGMRSEQRAMTPLALNQYIIRYRCDDRRGRTALIVEDPSGAAYLFSGGSLQGRLRGSNASTRLHKRLARLAQWRQVPRVAPYSIDGLRQMTR